MRAQGSRRLIMSLLSTLLMLSSFFVLAGTAEAATCGGRVVYKADVYKWWTSNGPEFGIWVSRRTGGSITRITFQNDTSLELVRNAQDGVSYNTPIGYDGGNNVILGVSKRWIGGHGNWNQTWRWNVWYNC